MRPASEARSEPAVNMTRRRWRMAKDTGDSLLAGKSGAAEREKRSRVGRPRVELDEQKGFEIDQLFEMNLPAVAIDKPHLPVEQESLSNVKAEPKVMDIDALLDVSGVIETPVLQPLLSMRSSAIPRIEVQDCAKPSEEVLLDIITGELLEGTVETLLEKCSISDSRRDTTGIWKMVRSL